MVIFLVSPMHRCVNPQGFLKRRSPQEAEILRQLYAETFPDLYRFSIQNLEYKMEVLEAFVITQSTHVLQGVIPPKVRGCAFLLSTLCREHSNGN